MSNRKITPFQLFFLTFSYVLSGFFLLRTNGLFPLLMQFLRISLSMLFLRSGFSKSRDGYCDFVFSFTSGRIGSFLAIILLIPAAWEMIRTAILFVESAGRMTTFFPQAAPVIFLAVLLGFACHVGVTGLGRFSELLPIVIVGLLLRFLLRAFSPAPLLVNFDANDIMGVTSVAPILFLASKTVVPSDNGISDAMQNVISAPICRERYISRILFGGIASATIFSFVLSLCGGTAKDIFLHMVVWLFFFMRLAVLFTLMSDVCQSFVRLRKNRVGRAVFAVTVVLLLFGLAALENTEEAIRFGVVCQMGVINVVIPLLLFAIRNRKGKRKGR